MRVEGLRTDLSLIIKPARRSAAAKAMVASFVTCGSRDEIRMSSMYTSHSTGQCFSADRMIAETRRGKWPANISIQRANACSANVMCRCQGKKCGARGAACVCSSMHLSNQAYTCRGAPPVVVRNACKWQKEEAGIRVGGYVCLCH